MFAFYDLIWQNRQYFFCFSLIFIPEEIQLLEFVVYILKPVLSATVFLLSLKLLISHQQIWKPIIYSGKMLQSVASWQNPKTPGGAVIMTVITSLALSITLRGFCWQSTDWPLNCNCFFCHQKEEDHCWDAFLHYRLVSSPQNLISWKCAYSLYFGVFNQLFELLFYRHPLITEDPLVQAVANVKCLQISSNEETNASTVHLGCPVGKWHPSHFQQNVFFWGRTIPLTQLAV